MAWLQGKKYKKGTNLRDEECGFYAFIAEDIKKLGSVPFLSSTITHTQANEAKLAHIQGPSSNVKAICPAIEHE